MDVKRHVYYDETQHANLFCIHVVYHYWMQYNNKLYISTGYSITTACGIVFMLYTNTGGSTSCTPELETVQQQRLAIPPCCIPVAATVQLYVAYQYWQQYNNMLCTNGVWICLHGVYQYWRPVQQRLRRIRVAKFERERGTEVRGVGVGGRSLEEKRIVSEYIL